MKKKNDFKFKKKDIKRSANSFKEVADSLDVDGEVRVIAMISGDWSGNGSGKRNPMPKDYLSETNMPKELIKQSIEKGWTDEDGNIYFPEDWQPEPMKADDGNVYLLANDQTPMEEIMLSYCPKAYRLLSVQ